MCPTAIGSYGHGMRRQGVGMRNRAATLAFTAAAVAGLIHSAASLYWAIGGRWQLESVGGWAVVGTGLGLGVLAVLKGLAAVIPALNERRHGNFYRAVRTCGWIGGGALVVWGGLSMLSAWAVLAGVITPSGGYDRATMIGHAAVWDPLFLIWGGALLIGLWVTGGRMPYRRVGQQISPTSRSPRAANRHFGQR